MDATIEGPVVEGIGTALKQHFGFDQFQPGQEEVIRRLIGGQSAAAIFPTGGGKSLCYQLPAMMLPGLTLVISPLIALMKDQIDALMARGIAAARLDSTLSVDQYREVMADVRSGNLRLLYVAPERLNNERFRESIRRVQISLFAVDEAHCISEWGHNFRPDYLKLAMLAKESGAERLLALTATATDQVLADICRLFAIDPEAAVRTGFYRANLSIQTRAVTERERDDALLAVLQGRPVGPTIVYVTLQRTAEDLAERLDRAGLDARPYHAGMEDENRASVQDWFMQSDHAVVVATIAFGMGIDKSNIRYVYHYNLPKSLENFSQEIGRAGRDGEPAICELFYCPDDLSVLENFVYGDTPTAESVRSLMEEIFSLGSSFDISIHELSSAHDVRLLVVRTLLVYLELDGYLEGGTPFYSIYQIKPLVSSAEILAKFETQRRQFLQELFGKARKAKTWLHIDVDRAAQELGTSRLRIVRALDYLGQQGWLEVKSAGVRHRYQRVKTPKNLEELAKRLHSRTLERETRELARLKQVPDLVAHDGCQASALGAHYGQPLERPCGHCTWCVSERRPVRLPERTVATFESNVWGQATALRRAHPKVLSNPRSLARFLCGVSSPRLIHAKLTKDPLFGALDQMPFQEVLARAEES